MRGLRKAFSCARQYVQRHLHHQLAVALLRGGCQFIDAVVWGRPCWRWLGSRLQRVGLAAIGAFSYLARKCGRRSESRVVGFRLVFVGEHLFIVKLLCGESRHKTASSPMKTCASSYLINSDCKPISQPVRLPAKPHKPALGENEGSL